MRDSRQRGVALVAVLWVLLLLSFLAAGFSSTARTEVNLSRNLVENAKAEALADAGVSRALMLLIAPPLGVGMRVDGRPYAWAFDGGDVRLAVWDEDGKIALNSASDRVLARLFGAVGLTETESETLVDRVADYRDADDDARPLGAEDRDYLAAERPNGAKNRDFERLDELQQVLGLDGAVYRAVEPALTVYSRRQSPDLDVASPLIRSLFEADLFPGREQPIASGPFDRQYDEQPGLETSNFGTLGDVLNDDGESTATAGSGTYLIHSEGLTSGGGVFVREAIVQIPGPENELYGIFEWRQGRRAFFPTGASEFYSAQPNN